MPEENTNQTTQTSFRSRNFFKQQNKPTTVIKDDLNTVVGSFAKSNVKLLNGVSKQLENLNKNISSLSRMQYRSRDFVKREDPMVKLIKEIDDLEELARERNRLAKEKKSSGLFGLGTLLGLSGLIGYALTGKKELLNNVIKGLTKFSPLKYIMNAFDGALKKVGGWILKPIGKVFKKMTAPLGKGIGKILSKVKEPFVKMADNFFPKILKKVFAPLGKGVGKAFGKGASKSALKKIPVLGGLIGLFFGIQRFKNGEIVEGILEIGSGIASVIPGVGTVISLGIDALLLFKDLSGLDLTGGVVDTAKKVGSVGKKIGMSALKKIAGFGPIAKFIEGVKLWKSDKLGSIKTIASAIMDITPVGIISNFLGIVDFFKKDESGESGLGKTASAVGGFVKNIATDPIGTVKSLIGFGKKAVGSGKNLVSNVTSGVRSFGSSVASGVKSFGSSIGNIAEGAGGVIGNIPEMVSNIPSSIRLLKPGVDIWGLNPAVRESLFGLAREHMMKYGSPIQVNSAFRSIDEQRRLYKKNPNLAAKPGRSRHNYGMAVDIQTKGRYGIKDWGLLNQYGFHRPIPSREPWHVEYGRKQATNSDVVDSPEEIGDPVSRRNLPSRTIADQIKINNDKPIDLSEKSIEMLADKLSRASQNNNKIQMANVIDVSMRS